MTEKQSKWDADLSLAGGHMPVMLNETIALLNVRADHMYIDVTAGSGGHFKSICQKAGSSKNIIAFDQDIEAIERLRKSLGQEHADVKLIHSNFVHLKSELAKLNINTINGGILADLGVSSNQLDEAERGFSFLREGPLDMRMDIRSPISAYDLVNDLDESELASIIYQYGEERHSRMIARAIVRHRPIKTTLELANIIENATRSKRISNSKRHKNASKLHPATRTFQALRIAVNSELDNLKHFLEQSIDLLAPGARLVVITFHSLEDRIVKQFFKEMASNCICPPRQPICTCKQRAKVQIITPKPLVALEEEILANIRSRSAKLRAVEKLPLG